MENIETQEQTIYIESWTLIDFALALEEAFYNGYEVSDKNEYAPIQIGGCYACTLVKTSLHSDPHLEDEILVDTTALKAIQDGTYFENTDKDDSGEVTSDDVVVTVELNGETVVVNPVVEEDIVIPQLQPSVVQQDEVQSETQQETSTDVAEETATGSVAKPRGRKPSQK